MICDKSVNAPTSGLHKTARRQLAFPAQVASTQQQQRLTQSDLGGVSL